jgi:DNA-binding response OmpR family regulator
MTAGQSVIECPAALRYGWEATMPLPAQRPQEYFRPVLIVEDDYYLAELLSEVLTFDNCVAEIAANGMEALDKVRGAHYEAIICDLMMPRVDGEAFYKEVARLYPYLAHRFLFITGAASTRIGLTDFIYATGNPLLLKPFEPAEFRAALKEVLRR